jgi:hypothetical protein
MALSESVENSLKEAEQNLRNALAFAARQEKPYVSIMISDMISKIDTLIQLDLFSDKLEEKFKNTGFEGFGSPF